MNSDPVLELERRISVADLDGTRPRTVVVEASEVECGRLAERLRIEAVVSLRAEVELRRELTGDIVARGKLPSDVVQACVVTLEPVPSRIGVEFEQRFSDRSGAGEAEDEDPVEAIVDGEIEIGDIVTQNLSLSLDPYPRAPGVEFEEFDDDPDTPSGPFAALSQLRRDDGENPDSA